MQLLVIRHAPAEDAILPGGSDAKRELTAKGRKLFAEFVERIIKPEHVPDLILCSPLVRTVQTANILAEVTGLKSGQVRTEPLLAPGILPPKIVSEVNALFCERVALVGHNPDVGVLTSYLLGAGSFEFKKGSAACIEFGGTVAANAGVLQWFLPPKLIVRD